MDVIWGTLTGLVRQTMHTNAVNSNVAEERIYNNANETMDETSLELGNYP
jgi:hypothetical protein